jgi:hypothetical protein
MGRWARVLFGCGVVATALPVGTGACTSFGTRAEPAFATVPDFWGADAELRIEVVAPGEWPEDPAEVRFSFPPTSERRHLAGYELQHDGQWVMDVDLDADEIVLLVYPPFTGRWEVQPVVDVFRPVGQPLGRDLDPSDTASWTLSNGLFVDEEIDDSFAEGAGGDSLSALLSADESLASIELLFGSYGDEVGVGDDVLGLGDVMIGHSGMGSMGALSSSGGGGTVEGLGQLSAGIGRSRGYFAPTEHVLLEGPTPPDADVFVDAVFYSLRRSVDCMGGEADTGTAEISIGVRTPPGATPTVTVLVRATPADGETSAETRGWEQRAGTCLREALTEDDWPVPGFGWRGETTVRWQR